MHKDWLRSTPIPLHPDDRPKSVRWQQDIDIRLPYPIVWETLNALMQRQERLTALLGSPVDPENMVIEAALERCRTAERLLREAAGL